MVGGLNFQRGEGDLLHHEKVNLAGGKLLRSKRERGNVPVFMAGTQTLTPRKRREKDLHHFLFF